jgi:hypothetical protein
MGKGHLNKSSKKDRKAKGEESEGDEAPELVPIQDDDSDMSSDQNDGMEDEELDSDIQIAAQDEMDDEEIYTFG